MRKVNQDISYLFVSIGGQLSKFHTAISFPLLVVSLEISYGNLFLHIGGQLRKSCSALYWYVNGPLKLLNLLCWSPLKVLNSENRQVQLRKTQKMAFKF